MADHGQSLASWVERRAVEPILVAMTLCVGAHRERESGKRWWDGFILCQPVQADLDFPEFYFLYIYG